MKILNIFAKETGIDNKNGHRSNSERKDDCSIITTLKPHILCADFLLWEGGKYNDINGTLGIRVEY